MKTKDERARKIILLIAILILLYIHEVLYPRQIEERKAGIPPVIEARGGQVVRIDRVTKKFSPFQTLSGTERGNVYFEVFYTKNGKLYTAYYRAKGIKRRGNAQPEQWVFPQDDTDSASLPPVTAPPHSSP
ncbi:MULTISPECIES: hypothetical protein [Paenibacillus]|uniref:hypothetical protein n=1 Tax=Paenibacillus TaxID=44249 RepID=UPI0022B8B87D|nr:hypothetical protein [Paenibacillus caseinilyticus]MCZ8519933.1 hypothetical protein [Paenibacillus caseinilyticus]